MSERVSPCLIANIRGDESFVDRLIRLGCLVERGWLFTGKKDLETHGLCEAILWNEAPRDKWDGLIQHLDAQAERLLNSMGRRSFRCEWRFASTDFFPDTFHGRTGMLVTPRIRLYPYGSLSFRVKDRPYTPGIVELAMHSGWAFGTGNHPSTVGCLHALDWLSSQGLLAGRSVLDIGTGTGILSLVAVRFGAKSALGIDVDPEALAVARTNVERNGLEGRVTISSIDIKRLEQGFDLVMANLTPSVLLGMLSDIVRLAGDGGIFLLAGCRKKAMASIVKDLVECADIIWQDSIEEWETRIFKPFSMQESIESNL